MTGAAITELGLQKAALVQSAKQQPESGAQNFADFMAKDTSATASAAPNQAKAAGTDAKTAYENSDRKAAENIAKDAQQKVSSPKPEKQEAAEQVSEDTKQIVKEIAEELEVSEEDIEAAMELLGLTAIDLMSQGNMTQLIAQVKEMPSVEIITDSDLFAQMETLVSDVTEIFTQTAESFDMDVQEFVDFVAEAPVEAAPVTEEQVDALPAQEEADMARPAREQAVANAAEDQPQVKVVMTDRPIMEEPVIKEETSDQEDHDVVLVREDQGRSAETPQEAAQQSMQESEQEPEHETQSRAKRSAHDTVGAVAAGNVQPGSEPTFAPVVEPETPLGEAQMPRTQEIIDQISDYVRIHRSEQLTEMEISLNPASLGNIHLQVASKAGTVSAQLIAQDQAVAAALESQIVILKEALEAQGMRVDAVEVTVASHGFEENLDQQGKEQEDEAQRTAAKKGQRRILDLNAVDEMGEEAEELTDAEKLQVEMMRMGGNRMNYQV